MTRRIFTTAVTLLAVCTLFSCKKDVDLTGTTWSASTSITMSEGMMTVNMDINSTFLFQTAEKGVFYFMASTEWMGMPMSMCMPGTFTYTFDGDEEGSMTLTTEDTTITEKFTYSRDNKTLTIKLPTTDTPAIPALVFKESKASTIASVVGTTWSDGNGTDLTFTSATEGTLTYNEKTYNDEEGDEEETYEQRTAAFTYTFNTLAGSMQCNVIYDNPDEESETFDATFLVKSSNQLQLDIFGIEQHLLTKK